MKNRRDIVILIALFLALVIFTILGPGRTSDDSLSTKPTTHASTPGGTLALLRWVQQMDYHAERLEYRPFSLDNEVATLFVINPSEPFNQTQTDLVFDWVANGGNLIVVDNRPSLFTNNALLHELDIRVEGYEGSMQTIDQAPVVQPLLHTPNVQIIQANTGYILTTARNDVVPLVGLPVKGDADLAEGAEGNADKGTEGAEGTEGDEGLVDMQAVVVGMQHGRGYIYMSSALYPFTNAGLRYQENAAFVLNLLRRTTVVAGDMGDTGDTGGTILFDEWHHGFHTPPSLRTLILGSAWGQGVVYALVVLAIYLVWTGRRFGKPIPLREDVALRSSVEYAESMADLFQRGRKHDYILHHYANKFKRTLARPYGINPRLDDTAFDEEIARYHEGLDQQALLALLARLRREHVSEEVLTRTVADVLAYTKQAQTRR